MHFVFVFGFFVLFLGSIERRFQFKNKQANKTNQKKKEEKQTK